jgi:hypothetical protein
MLSAALVTAGGVTGCAHITLGPPVVTEKPIDTKRVAIPEPNGFVGSADLSGSDLDVNAKPACDLVDQTTVEETTTREKHNLNKAADWWIIAGSVASFAGGAAFIYEGTTTTSSSTMPMMPTGTMNGSGSTPSPGTYYAGGVALVGLGALLATVAIYDAAKSAGSEKTVRLVKRDGEPVQKAIACPGLATSGASVTVHLSDKDAVNLGTLGAQPFRLDLDHALADHPTLPRFVPVFVGSSEVGKVNTSPIMKAREERDWAGLPRAGCSNPTTPSSCGPIESFIVTYPEGAHVADAKAIVEAARPAVSKLAEATAYKSLDLSGCLGRVPPTHVPDPDTMDIACGGLQAFLDTYPSGAHAKEVADVQKTGRAQAAAMRERQAVQAAAQQKAAQAAQRGAQAAADAKAAAEREQFCTNACLVRCSSSVNESSCFVGCVGLCKNGQM